MGRLRNFFLKRAGAQVSGLILKKIHVGSVEMSQFFSR